MKPVFLVIILIAAVFLACVGVCTATGMISYTEENSMLGGENVHITTLTYFGVTTSEWVWDDQKIFTRIEGNNVTSQSWFKQPDGSWKAGEVHHIYGDRFSGNQNSAPSGVTIINATENGWTLNNETTTKVESSLFRCGWTEFTPADGFPQQWTTCYTGYTAEETVDIYWTAENESILAGIKSGVDRCKELQKSLEESTREGSWDTVRSTVQSALEGTIDAESATVIIGSNWLIEPWEGQKMIEEGIEQSHRIAVNMKVVLENNQT